jgi:hypothetical protein
LENLNVDGRIILNWIIERWNGRLFAEFFGPG